GEEDPEDDRAARPADDPLGVLDRACRRDAGGCHSSGCSWACRARMPRPALTAPPSSCMSSITTSEPLAAAGVPLSPSARSQPPPPPPRSPPSQAAPTPTSGAAATTPSAVIDWYRSNPDSAPVFSPPALTLLWCAGVSSPAAVVLPLSPAPLEDRIIP